MHEFPRRLDRVAPHEQRGVAGHHVEQQPLVGLGGLVAEGGPVAEVHLHRIDPDLRARQLGGDPSESPSSGWIRSARTFGSSGTRGAG